MGRESEVQLSTSAKRGFRFKELTKGTSFRQKPRLAFMQLRGYAKAVLVVIVLSCISTETQGFKLALGGFCSLEEKLHG